MGPAPGDTDSNMPLQWVNCIGRHLKTVAKPEPRCYYKKHTVVLKVALAVMYLGLIIAVIVLAVQRSKLLSADLCPPAGPACPDGWVGYQGKCYYFSEPEGNFTYVQRYCSSLGASLAGIDNKQEMAFLLRHKDIYDHWIGLWREQGQPWKWTNGTEFNHLFRIRGGGDCAYLNDEKGVSSSRCYIERRWICSKPEVYVMGKGTALEGSLK